MSEKLEVAVDRLYDAGNGWTRVGDNLSAAKEKVESAEYSRLQFGVFQIPWNQYTETAEYIKNRIGEGVTEAGEISDTLKNAARDYATEEGVFTDKLNGKGEGVPNP